MLTSLAWSFFNFFVLVSLPLFSNFLFLVLSSDPIFLFAENFSLLLGCDLFFSSWASYEWYEQKFQNWAPWVLKPIGCNSALSPTKHQQLIDPFHNNIQFKAGDVIPCTSRIYTIPTMLKNRFRTISCVTSSNACFWDVDPHYIKASDVPGSIEPTPLWNRSILKKINSRNF